MTDDPDAARLRYPVGDHVTGTVTLIPRPGAIGLFVDLGHPPTGFVDVLHLPHSEDRWPPVGTTSDFEVLQHRPGQVRLWPLDEAFRSRTSWLGMSEPEWLALKGRYPLGAEVDAEVAEVFPSTREYTVEFEGGWSLLAWTDTPPPVGTTARFVVDRLLDTTRRVLLRPAPGFSPGG